MDFRSIYETGADAYDALVSAEDADGNLTPAIERAVELAGRRIVEVGAGTGRVTRLLTAAGGRVIATEPAADMARVGVGRSAASAAVWCRAAADALPVRTAAADVAVAGWVLAHQREWEPTRWRSTVGACLDELRRVVRTAGSIVVIETLGTGFTEPSPPPELSEFYDWLEHERGFVGTWIRTDYQFASVDDAAAITGSFFGDAFAEEVRARRWSRVPECTGVWSLRV